MFFLLAKLLREIYFSVCARKEKGKNKTKKLTCSAPGIGAGSKGITGNMYSNG